MINKAKFLCVRYATGMLCFSCDNYLQPRRSSLQWSVVQDVMNCPGSPGHKPCALAGKVVKPSRGVPLGVIYTENV